MSLCLQQGGADKDSALTTPSDVRSKRYFSLHLCHMYKHTPAIDVWLLSHYTLFSSLCTDVCLLSYTCISALYCTTLSTHCATVLLCRIPRRWWLKVSAGIYDTSLLPSSSMKQAEGSREMEGEVVFRRDTKSNLLKAVSGTEWMYRRGAQERGRRVSVNAVVFVCLYYVGTSQSLCGYAADNALMRG